MTGAESKTYSVWDETGEDTIEAASAEEAAEAFARGGDYGVIDTTVWVNVTTEDPNGDVSHHKVALHPQEPKCTEGAHVWGELSARGNDGGVIQRETCEHCGLVRIEDTWARDTQDGTEGLYGITYETVGAWDDADEDDASEAWL